MGFAFSWFSISKTNLRYAGGPDAGGRGGDGDGEQLPDGGVHVVHLGNKNIFTVTFYSGNVVATWAMKMAAMASYRAVPSMLIVAPMGRMNLNTAHGVLLSK